ncbi:hypothetical protein CRUP_036839 [Coryphaenoides rupestris]|nr:hypothetical protein CRUP_036839 [Coryphaenoides rupestris]
MFTAATIITTTTTSTTTTPTLLLFHFQDTTKQLIISCRFTPPTAYIAAQPHPHLAADRIRRCPAKYLHEHNTNPRMRTRTHASPPRFTRTPEDQTGVQGGVSSFVCQATGDPQPKIVWNKKGKKVSNQRFEVIDFDDGSGSVLRIQPLRTPRDEAIYECHASNSAGEITASTRLTVLRDMGPQLKVVERSRTATMLCAASGNPDPEITWFKDFLPVNTSNNNGRIKQLRSGAPFLAS